LNARPEVVKAYCENSIDNFTQFNEIYGILYVIVLFAGVGYLTAVIQKLTIIRLKDNVQLSLGHMLLEIAIVIASGCFIILNTDNPQNSLVSDQCKNHVELTP
jgi:hypothetical protein